MTVIVRSTRLGSALLELTATRYVKGPDVPAGTRDPPAHLASVSRRHVAHSSTARLPSAMRSGAETSRRTSASRAIQSPVFSMYARTSNDHVRGVAALHRRRRRDADG